MSLSVSCIMTTDFSHFNQLRELDQLLRILSYKFCVVSSLVSLSSM